jgi:guanylate kinase
VITTIVMLCGKSASGKNYVKERLHYTLKDRCHLMTSYTTRPMRDGEVEGVDYWFCSNSQFREMIMSGKFIEHMTFNDWLYGTPSDDIEDGKINVCILSPKGVLNAIKALDRIYGRTINIVVMHLNANAITRLKRSIKREHGFKLEMLRRLVTDYIDFNGFYDSISVLSYVLDRPIGYIEATSDEDVDNIVAEIV